MNDNPYALFEYLRSHPEYGSYLHVWSLGKTGTIPEQYRGLKDVVFARRDTLSFAYFLACAGQVICNANLPDYFVRRPDQRYLNTWHGIPYKSLGRDTARAKFGSPAGTGTFAKATHVITPCEFMTEAMLSAYSMSGTSTARIAETGYPRVDLTVNSNREQLSRLRQDLGIEDSDGSGPQRPVVLYAPTWRDEGGQDTIDAELLMRDLKELAALDVEVMYRGHHRIDKSLQDQLIGHQVGRIITPPHEISSNELLTAVDILITDYSSIFFDFLPTGRPIVHYLYDLGEYAKKRGLNLTLEELPGTVARSTEELANAVQNAADSLRGLPGEVDLRVSPLQGNRYRRAQEKYCPREDGLSSKRALDFFFKNETGDIPVRNARDARSTSVFWAAEITDPLTSDAFLRKVVTSGGSTRDQTTLVIDRATPIGKEVLKAIKMLRGHISTVSYNRTEPSLLPSEAVKYEEFVALPTLTFDEACTLLLEDPALAKIFKRIYRHRLDDAQFDNVTLGPELSNHELALAAFAAKGRFSLTESSMSATTPRSQAVTHDHAAQGRETSGRLRSVFRLGTKR